MIEKILEFVQTNIIHIGYWVAMAIFGFVIRSVAKSRMVTMELKEDRPKVSKIKEKLKDRFKKTGEPQTATQEEIDSLFPKEMGE